MIASLSCNVECSPMSPMHSDFGSLTVALILLADNYLVEALFPWLILRTPDESNILELCEALL